MLAALLVCAVVGQAQTAQASLPSLKPGEAARVKEARAPVGTDRDGYVALLEALAAGDHEGLARLISEKRGFLATAEMRIEVVEIDGSSARVRVISGVNHAAREGYVGLRWLDRLPDAAQAGRVDPRIQALAELKAKRDRRSNPEQQILAEVFRDLMERSTTASRRTAMKPAPPSTEASAPVPGPTPADASAPPAPAPAATATAPAPAATTPATPVAPPARKGHLCGATTRSGEPCRRYVVKGEHCYQHGG
jgi:hypothetical protein